MNVVKHPSQSHILTLSLQEQNKVLGVGVNSETANMVRWRGFCNGIFRVPELPSKSTVTCCLIPCWMSSRQDSERPPASPTGGTVKWLVRSDFLNSLSTASSWFFVSIRNKTAGEIRLRNSLIRWTVKVLPMPRQFQLIHAKEETFGDDENPSPSQPSPGSS